MRKKSQFITPFSLVDCLIRSRDVRDQTQLTSISTTSTALLNFKVIGQRSRSRKFLGVFLCVWYYGYPRTVLSLDQSVIILFSYMNSQRWRGSAFLANFEVFDLEMASCLWR